MAAAMQVWWPRFLLLLCLTCKTSTFYVPGVAPINFHQNDPVEIKAVKLTSSRTQLPYEYYSLPFCQPSKITYKAENLGEVLRGDRIVNTPFQVLMNSEKKCEVLCSQSSKPVTLTVEQSRLVAERITEDYYVHLIADNLPVATRLELYSNNRDNDDKKKEKDVQFEHGYRLGFTDVNKIYLHNHLSFILYYHREDMEEDQEHTYRVVRFEVIPQSIRLEDLKTDEKNSCILPEGTNSSPQEIDPTKENQLYFTYSVHWEESDIKWASRWDTYLTMSDVQIHWFSIINSVVVVFFLSGILSMIIIRTLRKDIANYNKEDDIVRGLGWGGTDWKREEELTVELSTCQACLLACACTRVPHRRTPKALKRKKHSRSPKAIDLEEVTGKKAGLICHFKVEFLRWHIMVRRVFATKPNNLSLIPETHMVEVKN